MGELAHSPTTIVMTGGSAGFGAVAADQIRAEPRTRLRVGSRGGTVGPALDLTDLDSVREFAAAVAEQAPSIDALVLNAGIILPDADHRTAAGLETTFTVNYLAQFHLIQLLLPQLRAGGRIVVTTSGTHDPAMRAGLVPPRHAEADLLAHPDLDPGRAAQPGPAGQHAYTASKLCLLLATRVLVGLLRCDGCDVVALCPGQVFGTQLAQSLSRPRRLAWRVLGSPVGWLPRRLQPTWNTRAAAGRALASLALGRAEVPESRYYAALRRGRLTWPDPSELAQNDELARALWDDSERLLSLIR